MQRSYVLSTLSQSRPLEGCGGENNSRRTVAVFYRRVALLSRVLIEKAAANLKVLLKPGRQRNILVPG
jgi:hypothetical protein